MTEQELLEIDFNTLKGFIRDMNLEIISNNINIEFNINKRYHWFQRFKPNWKLIKYATKNGAILTGSRALSCYTVDGKKIIERKLKDFDFIITRDMAVKFCNKFKFKYDITKDFIEVRGHYWDLHGTYGNHIRYVPCDIHFIIVDDNDIPEYNEKNGIKLANISYIINNKLNLLKYLKKIIINRNYVDNVKGELEKHFNDIMLTIIRSKK